MKRVFSLILIGVLASCASTPKVTTPNWYINPIANQGNKLYGVGQGLSKKAAKQRALEDILQFISVELATQSTSSQTVSLGQLSSSYNQKSKISTSNIQFTKVTEEQTAQSGVDYYMQVSVNKSDIVDSLNKKANKHARELKAAVSEKNSSPIDSLLTLNKQQKALKELVELTPLLSSFDPHYSEIEHERLIQQFIKKRASLVKQFSIKIDAPDTLTPLVDSIYSYFNRQNVLKVSAKPDLLIVLRESSQQSSLYGSTTAEVSLNIQLKDRKNTVIYKENVKKSASSVTSFAKAKTSAITQLAKQVNDLNSIKHLGF